MIGAFLLWRTVRENDHAHDRDGKGLALVTGLIPCPLTTFIMSYALAHGLLGAGLAITAAMAVGMVVTIGGVALCAAYARSRFVGFLDDSEDWRRRLGKILEVAGAVAVLSLGLLTVARA
jgi:nickel/cobalt exporter